MLGKWMLRGLKNSLLLLNIGSLTDFHELEQMGQERRSISKYLIVIQGLSSCLFWGGKVKINFLKSSDVIKPFLPKIMTIFTFSQVIFGFEAHSLA